MWSEQRVKEQTATELVLEDDAADGDADGLAEGAEEGEERDGEGDVGLLAAGLYGEGEPREEKAQADAVDQVDEDPLHRRGVHVQKDHEADAHRRNEPARPQRPAVHPGLGHDDAACDRGRDHGEGLREGGDAGGDGSEIFDGFIVKWEEIEDGPKLDDGVLVSRIPRFEDNEVEMGKPPHPSPQKDQKKKKKKKNTYKNTMHKRAKVGHHARASTKDRKPYHRLCGDNFFVSNEADQTARSNRERDQGPPARPRIDDPAPGDWNDEASQGGDKKHRPEPIDAPELLDQRLLHEMKSQEEHDHDKSHRAQGEVDPENPYPGSCLLHILFSLSFATPKI